MIKGIDVSSIQGNINWAAIKSSGIDFAVVKCFQGNDFCDPNFSRNITGAKAAGLKTICYQFPYPLKTDPAHPNRDPIGQANLHFKASQGELAAIDCEWPAPVDFSKWGIDAAFIRQWLLSYLTEYERLSGRKPLLYTYPDWSRNVHFEFNPEFAQYPLWIASYGGSAPFIPKPWQDFVIWQNTGGGGHLPSGAPVDTDVCPNPDLVWGQTVFTNPVEPPIVQPNPTPVPVPETPAVPAPAPANGNFWTSIGNSIFQLFGKK